MSETFTPDQVDSAIAAFLEYGEQSLNDDLSQGGHRGYFSGNGWAARCLRWHRTELAALREQLKESDAKLKAARQEALTFDAVRDGIVGRMQGHTISAQDAPAWRNFMALLKLVKASECAIAADRQAGRMT